MDMEYHTHYDPQRSEMHASIVDKYFEKKLKQIIIKLLLFVEATDQEKIT